MTFDRMYSDIALFIPVLHFGQCEWELEYVVRSLMKTPFKHQREHMHLYRRHMDPGQRWWSIFSSIGVKR